MCLTSDAFIRRAGYLLIAGAFLLLWVFFFYRSSGARSETVVKVKVVPVETSSRAISLPVLDFDSASYYRTIIDNNLFRPLGWTPPRPIEPYRLIGTKLAYYANTPPQAILQSTTGETTYIVSIGETLDASTEVVDIQPKQVTLSSNGEQRTLRLNTAVTLNASAATRSPRRTTHTPPPRRARVRSSAPPAPPAFGAPQLPDRPAPLSDWETRSGQPIPIGDARLKNPQKWGLRRR